MKVGLERSLQKVALEIVINGETKILEQVIESYYSKVSEAEKRECSLTNFKHLIEEKLSHIRVINNSVSVATQTQLM
jgi:hypothetical protein